MYIFLCVCDAVKISHKNAFWRHKFQSNMTWIQKTTSVVIRKVGSLWNLQYQNTNYWWVYNDILYYFQISHHHLRWSSVTVETADTSDPHPPVEKVFSQVGYGEDRYGGHTADLLKTVNQRIGHMSSFTGVASADRWRIYLNKQWFLSWCEKHHRYFIDFRGHKFSWFCWKEEKLLCSYSSLRQLAIHVLFPLSRNCFNDQLML